MPSAVTINPTYANGRPLAVLEKLINRRLEILRQSRKDAVVATAITVLKSIRARTKRHTEKGGKGKE